MPTFDILATPNNRETIWVCVECEKTYKMKEQVLAHVSFRHLVHEICSVGVPPISLQQKSCPICFRLVRTNKMNIVYHLIDRHHIKMTEVASMIQKISVTTDIRYGQRFLLFRKLVQFILTALNFVDNFCI